MIIFDFDQTLVDTSPVEHLRAKRDWKGVMNRVDGLRVYPGIDRLLADIHARGHTLAIVTKSPDMVVKAFIRKYAWPIDIVVGYHDVTKRKPDPEGLLLAIKRGRASAAVTVHVGDQAQDTEAARSAKVTAIGVTWGIADTRDLEASKPDELFAEVVQLEAYLARLALP